MNLRNVKINIEPGLFEWTKWCQSGLPCWMSASEYEEIGYNVDPTYKPYVRPEDLSTKETVEDFYERSYKLVREITRKYSGKFVA